MVQLIYVENSTDYYQSQEIVHDLYAERRAEFYYGGVIVLFILFGGGAIILNFYFSYYVIC